MSITLMYKGQEVTVQERAATADVRKQVARLNVENQKAVTSIAKEFPEILKYKNLTEEERQDAILENPDMALALIDHNSKVEEANIDYVLGYVRAIINHTPITDPELLDAVKSDVQGEFWGDQDPEALRPYVDRFREAYKL